MNDEICLHGIYALSNLYNSDKTLQKLNNILKSKALLSKRLQNIKDDWIYYNGLDYISLCDYSKRNLHYCSEYNAYEGYIRYSLSLMFPKSKLSLITPVLVDLSLEEDYYGAMKIYGMMKNKRYSDMPDEVQVKDYISLDLMSGITLPVKKMRVLYGNEYQTLTSIQKELEKINILLDRYNYNVPIYDIDSFLPLDDKSNVKELVRTMYRK